MEWLLDPQVWIAFATLTALEIVLGIDNIIFLSILVAKLPPEQQAMGRRIGLTLAMLTRIALLLSLAWIMKLTAPMFTVFAQEISGRDLILLFGGLFLLVKSTMEIHGSLEGEEGSHNVGGRAKFLSVVVQIAILDIVFSLDSVITAVGMVDQISVMVAAIMVAVIVMLFAAKPIGDFVDNHPSVKMLALSFLIVVGTALIAESFDVHVPKGYIYFAMAFSVAVEGLNIRLRKKRGAASNPVKLRKSMTPDHESSGE